MKRISKERELNSLEEALEMYKLYNERFFRLMMMWIDNDERIEHLIDVTERNANFWKDRITYLMWHEEL